VKYYVKVIAVWACCLLPVLATASQNGTVSLQAMPVPVRDITTPGRDAGDEDSVVYEMGFENNDWEGWTTIDEQPKSDQEWHTSQQNAFEDGSSWWCANEDSGGYGNHWLQYLMTPVLNLNGLQSLKLTFKLYYACEDPSGNPPGAGYEEYDAWDGCNVWISTDGGDSWDVIEPVSPDYDYTSLFSFGWEWGMGPDVPGWCAYSDGWLDAEFNLANYASDNVRIRWAFCSDPAWDTADDANAIGMVVDNLQISAGDDVIWSNDGSEAGDMELDQGPISGDHWEITNQDAHSSDYSAHCPISAKLMDALVTPAIEVPSAEYYTYFDFWVRCDTRMSNSNPEVDNGLDDFFSVWIQPEDGEWIRMVYDYADTAREDTARPGQWFLPHHLNWWTEFGYYGPDTAFQRRPDWEVEDWQYKLNLTPFAGETIYLKWVLQTDWVMTDPQGTGIWIDDFKVNVSARDANDVGVDWLKVPYPMTMGFPTRCGLNIKNYGMADQNVINKYFQIDENTPVRVGNPGGLQSDSSTILSFYVGSGQQSFPYADTVNIYGIAGLDGDQNNANDSYEVKDVVIYPPGILSLGYDQWSYRYRFIDFGPGHGPMVYFTPRADGYRLNYDLKALRVRWSDVQTENTITTLHIYADNRGVPGAEIYSDDLTVTADVVWPFVHVIDLTGVQELQGRIGNFWVWFEIQREDHWPEIIGDTPDLNLYLGPDEVVHYYDFDGQTLTERPDDQFQIHAIIMAEGTAGRELVPGRHEMAFGGVALRQDKTIRLAMFNGSTEEVTIEDVQSTNEVFEVLPDFDMPKTLKIGDMAHVYVTFAPDQQDADYSAELNFTTDDQTPPVVRLTGHGGLLGVTDAVEALPSQFSVGAAYPDPFNAMTTIPYALPHASAVKLTVYDLAGRELASLVSGVQPAGNHRAMLNGANLQSGIYLYRFTAGNFTASGKVALVK